MTRSNNEAFTLVELLVVIAIIGLLSTIVIASVNSARQKGKIAKAKAEIEQISKLALIAQGESGKPLIQITGNVCSECVCRGGRDLRNIPETDTCYTNWINALTKMKDAAGDLVGRSIENLKRDPWGSPYLLDENESEGTGCRKDEIGSAGPDGIWGTSDDVRVRNPRLDTCSI